MSDFIRDSFDLDLTRLDELHAFLMKVQGKANAVLNQIGDTHAFPRNLPPEHQQTANRLIESLGTQLQEIAHIEAFLQSCDLLPNNRLTRHQQMRLMECEALCQSLKKTSRTVLTWMADIKASLHVPEAEKSHLAEATAINDNAEQISHGLKTPVYTSHETVTEPMRADYAKFREIIKELHADMMFIDLEKRMQVVGKRLDVMSDKHLYLETEHELNVFSDLTMFQYYKDDKTVPQRFNPSHPDQYRGQKAVALAALKAARFSFLEIVKPMGDHGLVVRDPLTGEELMMIDNGLSQVAKQQAPYRILTHYVCLPDFVITTGASTPVLLTTPAAKAMQGIFDRLVAHHHQSKPRDKKTSKQLIIELYKIAIHENLLKVVDSRPLPFDYRALYRTSQAFN